MQLGPTGGYLMTIEQTYSCIKKIGGFYIPVASELLEMLYIADVFCVSADC